MSVSEVYRSPLFTLPGVTARLVGQTLRLPGVRLTHLLDTARLRRKAHAAIDIRQLRDNIADEVSRTPSLPHPVTTTAPLFSLTATAAYRCRVPTTGVPWRID